MSEVKRTPFGASGSCSVAVGPGGGSGSGVPFVSPSIEQRLMNAEGRLRVLEQSLQGQRLRADTAEAERSTWETRACSEATKLHEAEQKLAAAEQRITELEARYGFLRKVTPYRFRMMQDAASTDGGDVIYFHADRFDAQVDAALNPNPEAESHE